MIHPFREKTLENIVVIRIATNIVIVHALNPAPKYRQKLAEI